MLPDHLLLAAESRVWHFYEVPSAKNKGVKRPTSLQESLKEFHQDRLWYSVDGSVYTVGVTLAGLDYLGPLESIDILPSEAEVEAKGECLATIEGGQATLEVRSPVAGTVLEVNERLASELDILTEDPFEEGWIIKIEKIPGEADAEDSEEDSDESNDESSEENNEES